MKTGLGDRFELGVLDSDWRAMRPARAYRRRRILLCMDKPVDGQALFFSHLSTVVRPRRRYLAISFKKSRRSPTARPRCGECRSDRFAVNSCPWCPMPLRRVLELGTGRQWATSVPVNGRTFRLPAQEREKSRDGRGPPTLAHEWSCEANAPAALGWLLGAPSGAGNSGPAFTRLISGAGVSEGGCEASV